MKISWKITLITVATLIVSLVASSWMNIRSFRNDYTDALLSGGFGLGHSINSVLNEMLVLGLPLDSLSGMNERLQEITKNNSHIKYVGVVNIELRGKIFDDAVMIKSTQALEPIWQYYNRFDGDRYYDLTIPVIDPDNIHVGLIRLGFSTHVVSDKVLEASFHTIINIILTFAFIVFLLHLFLTRYRCHPLQMRPTHCRRAL